METPSKVRYAYISFRLFPLTQLCRISPDISHWNETNYVITYERGFSCECCTLANGWIGLYYAKKGDVIARCLKGKRTLVMNLLLLWLIGDKVELLPTLQTSAMTKTDIKWHWIGTYSIRVRKKLLLGRLKYWTSTKQTTRNASKIIPLRLVITLQVFWRQSN